MPQSELIHIGEEMMAVCNSCRYCEGFCAVWPAMEYRRSFAEADLTTWQTCATTAASATTPASTLLRTSG